MYIGTFKRYIEGEDITKIPVDSLTYPSKNVFIYKGVVYTRAGITNDGFDQTDDNNIIGEFGWEDQFYSPKFVRAKKNGVLQLRHGTNNFKWINIFTTISTSALRVRFDTWLDNSAVLSPLAKKRLLFVDGTANMHEWNGAVATVQSIAGAVVTLQEVTTPQGLGFDRGDTGGAKTVILVRFNASGDIIGQEEYTYTEAGSTNGQLTLSSTPTITPVAGDLIIAKPTTKTSVVDVNFLIDDIQTYNNQVVVQNLKALTGKASHALTYPLTWTIPVPASVTALTAYEIPIDGFFTAMGQRDGVLWVSSADDWWKVTKLLDPSPSGAYVEIKKFDQPERNGALPFAISNFNKDLLFVSQTKQLRQVTTQQLTGKDDIILLSDDVEGMFERLDFTECRLYFQNRYLYITLPVESQLLVCDMIGNPNLNLGIAWMPPQTIPAGLLTYFDGVQYAHSNSDDQTFVLFSGVSDLDSEIEAVMAFGVFGATDRHKINMHTTFGMNGRANIATKIEVQEYWETDGEKQKTSVMIDVAEIKTYTVTDDLSWTSWPWAYRGWAASDAENEQLRRFFIFDVENAASWFEFRPIFRITGKGNQFHLLGWGLDSAESTRKKDKALYITK